MIDIPTLHIFGCDDAFLPSAIALFNVCDQKTAVMYDHGLGHIVPRDAENVGLLSDMLAELIPEVEHSNKRREQLRRSYGEAFERTGSETDEAEVEGEVEREERADFSSGKHLTICATSGTAC